MTSFHVICGLGLPQSKILGRPMNWRSPEKIFEDLFFWRTLAAVSLVLGLGLEHSCPWPRAFLSLASRGSVHGKAVIGLGLGFFCVFSLGFELCVLDSTSANSKHGDDFY